MSRYIDVDKFIEDLGFENTEQEREENIGEIVTLEDFDRQPTEDVVKVVRCEDCKYYQDNNNGYPHNECKWCKDETPDADDFCSYGERKDEE